MPIDVTQVGVLLGAIVALLTFAKGVWEFSRQNALRRAEHFRFLRSQLKDTPEFRTICEHLEEDSPSLMSVSFGDKRDFLGLFEEVAISLNSGLIRPQIAHYMFGYYAIRCSESVHFWYDVNKRSPYWALFLDFAAKMKAVEERSPRSTRNYRF